MGGATADLFIIGAAIPTATGIAIGGADVIVGIGFMAMDT